MIAVNGHIYSVEYSLVSNLLSEPKISILCNDDVDFATHLAAYHLQGDTSLVSTLVRFCMLQAFHHMYEKTVTEAIESDLHSSGLVMHNLPKKRVARN